MSPSYTISVNSPCLGAQAVAQFSATLYTGLSGSFTYVVLGLDGTLGWVMTVYDYSNPLGPCYPFGQFSQVTPDASDPASSLYGLLDNGAPDTTLGAASVT